MNISTYEQRTLHALAQGGRIEFRKNDKRDIVEIDCFNRDGWRLDDCSLAIFRMLRRRRFIRSQTAAPIASPAKGSPQCGRSWTIGDVQMGSVAGLTPAVS